MSIGDRHLTAAEYHLLRDFLARTFGLFFDEGKITVLENRVVPLLQEFGCSDMAALLNEVKANPPRLHQLLDAVTTNETWFFRHPVHFDILREDVLPSIFDLKRKSGEQTLAVWSAGCSIGAEAFSLLIAINEALAGERDRWRVAIVGSDISSRAVQRAREGIYSTSEVRLLSPILINRYFTPIAPGTFAVRPEFREHVSFEQLNLIDPWPSRTFDLVFCRNTMIYFREQTKAELTERFYHALHPGGAFFVAATETLHWREGFTTQFVKREYVYRRPSVHREFAVFRFRTPSDLLRALNLVVRQRMNYRLQPDAPGEPSRPRKAIKIERIFERDFVRLLAEHNLPEAEIQIVTE